jgi:23S rRNA pseudouridine1911/1915/1917 synthase
MEQRIVDIDSAQMRLDIFLTHNFSEISRSRLQTAIREGDIRVNGEIAKKSTKLVEGDVITVDDMENLSSNGEDVPIIPQEMDLEILYEDEYYVVVNKEAGIVVHPGNGNPDGTLLNGLFYYLKDEPGTPRLVHRLDKDTSGVIICAKNEHAHDMMSQLFIKREVYKGYLGFCIGRYPGQSAIIDAPIGRSKIDPVKRTVRPDGRHSRTDYALLRYQSGISAIAYRLHTGRTHQIRVHSAYSGFPIVMDSYYGGEKDKVRRLEPMERPFAYRIYTAFHRQALHARHIEFNHPFTGEPMKIIAPLHPDFQKAMDAIGLTEEDIAVFGTEILELNPEE